MRDASSSSTPNVVAVATMSKGRLNSPGPVPLAAFTKRVFPVRASSPITSRVPRSSTTTRSPETLMARGSITRSSSRGPPRSQRPTQNESAARRRVGALDFERADAAVRCAWVIVGHVASANAMPTHAAIAVVTSCLSVCRLHPQCVAWSARDGEGTTRPQRACVVMASVPRSRRGLR